MKTSMFIMDAEELKGFYAGVLADAGPGAVLDLLNRSYPITVREMVSDLRLNAEKALAAFADGEGVERIAVWLDGDEEDILKVIWERVWERSTAV